MEWKNLLSKERPSKDIFSENEELDLTPFERDYYTIVTSSYFRRLQKKTQVYVLDDRDFSRTRLTHSLEVASIAEILGKRVGKRIRVLEGERGNELWEEFEDDLAMVLRCSGLLHDLGNPPFGHNGEEYIRDYFQENEERLKPGLSEQMWLDFINFEGNAQNIRIVTKLGKSSNPKDERYGMDLTFAVVNSLIKYPYNSLVYNDREAVDGKRRRGKIGYYHSEDWIVEGKKLVTGKTGTRVEVEGGFRLLKDPIMYLMEAADDIAYVTADIEDAIKKGSLDEDTIENELQEIIPDYYDKNITITLKNVREKAMSEVVDHFIANYDEIMAGTCDADWDLVEGCECRVKELKRFMSRDVYERRDQAAERMHNAGKKIMDILDFLINAVTRERAERSFSECVILHELDQYIEKGEREAKQAGKFEGKEQEELYHKYLSVVDYVSGMTDSYVSIFWNQIFSDEYLVKEKKRYKESCIKELMNVPQVDDPEELAEKIENILDEMRCVDNWEDYEISVILRCYLNNSQIKDNADTAFMQGLFARLSDEARRLLLTEDEIVQLQD